MLLLTDASKVLLHPKQWSGSCDGIVNTVVYIKRKFVQKWRSAVPLGDENARILPPPSRSSQSSNYQALADAQAE